MTYFLKEDYEIYDSLMIITKYITPMTHTTTKILIKIIL